MPVYLLKGNDPSKRPKPIPNLFLFIPIKSMREHLRSLMKMCKFANRTHKETLEQMDENIKNPTGSFAVTVNGATEKGELILDSSWDLDSTLKQEAVAFALDNLSIENPEVEEMLLNAAALHLVRKPLLRKTFERRKEAYAYALTKHFKEHPEELETEFERTSGPVD